MGIRCSVLKLWSKREVRVLIQGLDAAGKTTILYKLKLGTIVTTIPTIGFNVETLQHKNIEFTAWDVGGRCGMRPLWRHYYKDTQIIIFVVDSNDFERVDEARKQLHYITQEEGLHDLIVLVLANKQDLPGAMSTVLLAEHLQLHSIKQQHLIMPTVACTGEGLQEAMDFLADRMNEKFDGKNFVIQENGETTTKTERTVEKNSYMQKAWRYFTGLFITQ